MQKGAMTIQNVESQIDEQNGTLAMQGQLRQAIFDAISVQDVTEIVKKQVEKAKSGDEKSLQFVMKYVLGYGQPISVQQINVVSQKAAAKIANRR
jgi:hypothetical protein